MMHGMLALKCVSFNLRQIMKYSTVTRVLNRNFVTSGQPVDLHLMSSYKFHTEAETDRERERQSQTIFNMSL